MTQLPVPVLKVASLAAHTKSETIRFDHYNTEAPGAYGILRRNRATLHIIEPTTTNAARGRWAWPVTQVTSMK